MLSGMQREGIKVGHSMVWLVYMVQVDSLKCFLTSVDFNECANATTNNCDSNAMCANTPGSFTCTCNQGYTGNGVVCIGKYRLFFFACQILSVL